MRGVKVNRRLLAELGAAEAPNLAGGLEPGIALSPDGRATPNITTLRRQQLDS
jgi:hypothetical protein